MRYVRRSMLTVGALVCALLVGAAVAPATPTAAGCKAEAGTHIAATGSFSYALRVGMPEKMYTPAQVKTMHPKQGEVMLRGSMSMGGMSMGGSMRHLEVQLCSKATGGVIANANPTILVVDNSAKGMMTRVPVAVMEGIGKGIADLHYGNNVSMPAGHRFTITVTMKGERADFRVISPKAM